MKDYYNNGEEIEEELGESKVERRLLRGKRTVLLAEDIYSSTARKFVEDVLILSDRIEPITLVIASDGGSVQSGLACIKAIREAQAKGIKVIGRVYGHAMSMAFIILQCCDERIMGKLCTLMAHGVTTFSIGDLRNIDSERKLLGYWRKEISSLIANRCTERDSIWATSEFWEKIMSDNTPQYYDSEECLKMGLIDKID